MEKIKTLVIEPPKEIIYTITELMITPKINPILKWWYRLWDRTLILDIFIKDNIVDTVSIPFRDRIKEVKVPVNYEMGDKDTFKIDSNVCKNYKVNWIIEY